MDKSQTNRITADSAMEQITHMGCAPSQRSTAGKAWMKLTCSHKGWAGTPVIQGDSPLARNTETPEKP